MNKTSPNEMVVRKLGNSVGVIFSKEYCQQFGIQENDKVFLQVVKEANFKNLFGKVKRKMSGQAFKDMARAGWQ